MISNLPWEKANQGRNRLANRFNRVRTNRLKTTVKISETVVGWAKYCTISIDVIQ